MTTRDPHDLAGQARDAETEQVQATEKRRQEMEDIKWLMAHPQGRRIATRILEVTGVHRSSFNHSGSVMAFNEGRRDIGLFFQGEVLEAAPSGYLKLLQEFQRK